MPLLAVTREQINRCVLLTIYLLRGENEHEETINPVFATADSYY